jgi:uridine phosphorylase
MATDASFLNLFPRREPRAGSGITLPRGISVLTGTETPMHVKASAESLRGAGYAILAGDPGRIAKIAANFQHPAEVTTNRGYTVWRGTLEGVPVFAAAHGIGCASAAIVVEELALLGCHTVIRVGTCGSLQKGMKVGDVVVSTGCIRDDGTSAAYVPIEFPAIASHEVVAALIKACAGDDAPRPAIVGVTHCKASFYSEVPGYVPDAKAAAARWDAWVRGGAVATEMEAAALFIIGKARGMRAGVVLAVLGVTCDGPSTSEEEEVDAGEVMKELIQETNTEADEGKARAIQAAVQALRHLIRHDKGEPEIVRPRSIIGGSEEKKHDDGKAHIWAVAAVGVLVGAGLAMLLNKRE